MKQLFFKFLVAFLITSAVVLSWSEYFNYEEFVLLLLQNGAFFKAKDQDTRTQIEEGLMRKQMTVFETMIAYTH